MTAVHDGSLSMLHDGHETVEIVVNPLRAGTNGQSSAGIIISPSERDGVSLGCGISPTPHTTSAAQFESAAPLIPTANSSLPHCAPSTAIEVPQAAVQESISVPGPVGANLPSVLGPDGTVLLIECGWFLTYGDIEALEGCHVFSSPEQRARWFGRVHFDWHNYLGNIIIMLMSPLSIIVCVLTAWGVLNSTPALGWYPDAWRTPAQTALFKARLGPHPRPKMEPGMLFSLAITVCVYATIGIWLYSRAAFSGAAKNVMDLSVYHFVLLYFSTLFCLVSGGVRRSQTSGSNYKSPFVSTASGTEFFARLRSFEHNVGYLEGMDPCACLEIPAQKWEEYLDSHPTLARAATEITSQIQNFQRRSAPHIVRVPCVVLCATFALLRSKPLQYAKSRLKVMVTAALFGTFLPAIARAALSYARTAQETAITSDQLSAFGTTTSAHAVYALCLITDFLTFLTLSIGAHAWGHIAHDHWRQLDFLHHCVVRAPAQVPPHSNSLVQSSLEAGSPPTDIITEVAPDRMKASHYRIPQILAFDSVANVRA
jgi:hypothetical protein